MKSGSIRFFAASTLLFCFALFESLWAETYGWQSDFGSGSIPEGDFAVAAVFNGELIMAGQFEVAGAHLVNNMARWNGFEWLPVGGSSGEGVQPVYSVQRMLVFQNELIVQGAFNLAGGIEARGLAAWDGEDWRILPGFCAAGGSIKRTHDIAIHDGSLAVAAQCHYAGGQSHHDVWLWDGDSWTALGANSGDEPQSEIMTLGSDGESLYAVLLNWDWQFAQLGRWNGSNWADVGNPFESSVVSKLLFMDDDIYLVGGYPRLWRLEGSSWQPLGSLPEYLVALIGSRSFFVHEGLLYAATLTVTTDPDFQEFNFDYFFGTWDGSSWTQLDHETSEAPDLMRSFLEWDGDLIGVGSFQLLPDSEGLFPVARRVDDAWAVIDEMEAGHEPRLVRAIGEFNGELIVAGDMASHRGSAVNHIGRWNGTELQSLSGPHGTGLIADDGDSRGVHAILEFQNQLVVGGVFSAAGGVPANALAAWDGQAWAALTGVNGDGLQGNVFALAEFEGNLVAAGSFSSADGEMAGNIASWNGEAWSVFSGPNGVGTIGRINALAVYQGDLIAAGQFQSAGGMDASFIARWDGSSWNPMTDGSGFNGQIFALTVFDGELIVAGGFSQLDGILTNRLARWNGKSWGRFPEAKLDSTAMRLAVVDGELIVGGWFSKAGGIDVNGLARWDGVSWSGFGDEGGMGVDQSIKALGEFESKIYAGGNFFMAGDQRSDGLSWFRRQATTVEIELAGQVYTDPGEIVAVEIRVEGSESAPVNGRVTIEASDGRGCFSDVVSEAEGEVAVFGCDFLPVGSDVIELQAWFTASSTHANAIAGPIQHTVRWVPELLLDEVTPPVGVAGQPVYPVFSVASPVGATGQLDLWVGGEPACHMTLPDVECMVIAGEEGELNLALEYGGDAFNTPRVALFSYEVIASSLSFDVNPLDFGFVGIGQISEAGIVQLTNTSEKMLNITALNLSEGAGFMLTGGTCGHAPFSLPPESSCTLEFRFAPESAGPDSAVVQVLSDAPEGGHVFFLQGMGMDEVFQDRFSVDDQ